MITGGGSGIGLAAAGTAGATGADLMVEALGLVPALDAGWTAGTGTASQGAYAAYGGQTVGWGFSQKRGADDRQCRARRGAARPGAGASTASPRDH